MRKSHGIKKCYLTKYALTTGIDVADMEVIETDSGSFMVAGKVKPEDYMNSYFHKGEFFFTPEEALVNAEERRKRKIVSVEKQLKKLQNIKFEIK